MSIGSISSITGPLLDSISQNPQGPAINQIAALADANSTETSAILQLIQSVGQAAQTQVGSEPGSANSLNVYA